MVDTTQVNGPAPSFVQPLTPTKGVALVLSGGGARGYAHLGVIRVLEAHGLRPRAVVGASAGSIVGALYASGLTVTELDESLRLLGAAHFADPDLLGLGLLPGSLGVFRGDRLHAFIDQRARHHLIEHFPIRFAAVATDLASGAPQAFNAGDAGWAVRASSAVPGVMAPVEIGGRRYVDGGLSSPLPITMARQLGACRVIAVDVIYPPQDARPRTAMGVFLQGFSIAVHRLKALEPAKADLVIIPSLPATSGQLGFASRERLVADGELAAQGAIDRIRELFKSADDC